MYWIKTISLLLFACMPLLLSAQLDVKVYKLSETTDQITLRMEVKNNGKEDITIRNYPTFARDWHGTFIYFVTTDEIKQLKSGKVISSAFPYVFCPEKYEDKNNPEKSTFIPVKKDETERVDYVLNKKWYADRTIHIYGDISYRIDNQKGGGRTPIDMKVNF
ncbi:hypothetical protein [Proteiniphilum acetatigenes]|jgi:hypothetical protein|uniref:hypothetical protein n=1 Tax=Proteiniphilum acetatigenes TaxID=294710 RepID=UPI00039E845A|nr:hypothetical protein [Proteiniphilum acetatigenes]SFK63852.1 hypothetical protein SAMN05216357_10440 [Porphyromonadaceae bacterium KH3CP3RA]